MPKGPKGESITVRVSKETKEKIEELLRRYAEFEPNQSDIVRLAVDRLHKEECGVKKKAAPA
jgi:Arc/MetJ-type ribon-helix-helix transcriptional regulator